jgi:hypothetical protein
VFFFRKRISNDLETSQILHSFVIVADVYLKPPEIINVFNFLETEVIEIAKTKGYSSILAANVSPLTQYLAVEVFGYETLLQYKINNYIYHDGTRPFETAPDSQIVNIDLKKIFNK